MGFVFVQQDLSELVKHVIVYWKLFELLGSSSATGQHSRKILTLKLHNETMEADKGGGGNLSGSASP